MGSIKTVSPPNVLLVILDSVRSRNTSLYGYESDTTPFLSQFADNATTYQEARAPGANTMMSLTSMFTGLHVPEHGLTHRGLCLEPNNTIWEELDEKGYQTAVFSRNTNLIDLPIGLKNAFNEIYSGHEQRLPFPDALDPAEYHSDKGKDLSGFIKESILSDHPSQSVWNGIALLSNNNGFETQLPNRLSVRYDDSIHTQQFLNWIRGEEGPWAACINYMDAHIPYQPRSEHNRFINDSDPSDGDTGGSKWEFFNGSRSFEELEWLERLYDGAIHQVDAEVRRLIEELQNLGEYKNTFITVAGDHGDAFGEYGDLRDCRCVHHGITGGLHESVLHVPLLTKAPYQRSKRIISKPVTLTRFYDAARAVVEGNWSEQDLLTGQYVLAYSPGINKLECDRAKKYEVNNLSRFNKPIRIAYSQSNGATKSYISQDGDPNIIPLKGKSNTKKEEAVPEQILFDAYSGISNQEIVYRIDTDLDPDTKDRLEKLGYV